MRLLIIVTGSIAISKLPEMIKLLSKKKIKIDFIFTKSALSIMKSKQLLYLKNFRIYTDKLQKKKYNEMLHIELSRKADAIMIFPATANIIGKFSNGIAVSHVKPSSTNGRFKQNSVFSLSTVTALDV